MRDYHPGKTAAEVLASKKGVERSKWLSLFWEYIGVVARHCHCLSEQGFGVTSLLPEAREEQRDTLIEWVEAERWRLQSNTELVAKGVVSEVEYGKVIEVFAAIADWQVEPVLCHGDLSLANVLQTENGEYCVIDWGNAIAHRAPHFDVAEIAVWNPQEEWLVPFARGYQVSVGELREVLDESIAPQLWRVCSALQRDIQRMPQQWRSAPYAAQSMATLDRLLKKIL